MIGVLTGDTLRSAEAALQQGTFGLFDKEASTVFFEVYTQLNNHIAAIFPAAVCGLLCGLLAILFTSLNTRVSRLRAATIKTRRAKMLEPCVLIVLYVTLSMALPLLFPCTPTDCVVIQGNPQPYCPEGQPEYVRRVVGDSLELFTCPAPQHSVRPEGGGRGGEGAGGRSLLSWFSRTSSERQAQEEQAQLTAQQLEELGKMHPKAGEVGAEKGAVGGDKEAASSPISSSATFPPPSLSPASTSPPPSPEPIRFPKAYNELATLASVTGEDAIRHLFTRGTHREFGYASLLAMLSLYFVGAAWTGGSAISSGVFVPMLLIGACVGRLVGLATVDLAAARGAGTEGAPPGVFLPPSPWAWIDPGAFALIGAGAFMGGVTRMTLALAVIVMELSNDVRMLLPCMVAVMLAKWVADMGSHPLYHTQLEIKCIPFLPREPAAALDLDLLDVRHVAHWPVVTLREQVRLGDLRDVLRRSRHAGFPVVRDTAQGAVCVGLVVRDQLSRLVRASVQRRSVAGLELPYQLMAQGVADADGEEVPAGGRQQQLAVLGGRRGGRLEEVDDWDEGGFWDLVLDLGPYINQSAFKVPETFSLKRSYILFSTMGLRHLIVTDEHNRVKGIVTRKDLLGYNLDEAVGRVRAGGTMGNGFAGTRT
ncbi:voltage gated chloride channel protein [Helicosporidium sp. ATCC 50920]|nr:voltage gated chloride channel protein [Helicosporidium sp. ATCC 50920]|eukprot:KDD74684.1 voltage gated chloride channel protein [Helicosporidium sp. ATCC 50920]